MNKQINWNKAVKILSVAFFLIPILVLLVMESSYILTGPAEPMGTLYMIVIFGAFYTFSFLVNLPNLAVILISWLLLRKKVEKKYLIYYPALISNILMTILTLFLVVACNVDYSCRTSDAPLGTAFAWIIGFYLGNLFWTLPFMYVINNMVNMIFGKATQETYFIHNQHNKRKAFNGILKIRKHFKGILNYKALINEGRKY